MILAGHQHLREIRAVLFPGAMDGRARLAAIDDLEAT
jgi:hypothetical protein